MIFGSTKLIKSVETSNISGVGNVNINKRPAVGRQSGKKSIIKP